MSNQPEPPTAGPGPRFALLLSALLPALGCLDTPEVARVYCAEDTDCGAGLGCVVDLTQGASYCAARCSSDDGCPPEQRCEIGVPSSQVETPLVGVCVDRVRSCDSVDRCNGLDDDCDGVIDGPGCVPITPCLDDAPCGLFVCSAPVNQAAALCVPPNEAPRVSDFDRCAEDADCRNGVCETGRCAPLCRPPIAGAFACAQDRVCAEGVGAGLRPRFNQCQEMCVGPSDCTSEGEICAWRDVFQGGGSHHSVCARPDPSRRPNGDACPGRTPELEAECQSGLCFGGVCTRICGGPGSSCEDVVAGGECCLVQLQYGIDFEYFRYVCVAPGTPCG